MSNSLDTNHDFTIVTYHQNQDISWIEDLSIPSVIYEADPVDPLSTDNPNFALLRYIVEFYDTMPKNVIVIHPYNRKFWHDGCLSDKFKSNTIYSFHAKNPVSGYINFSNQKLGSIVGFQDRIRESGWWTACMEPYFGPLELYFDFTNGKLAHSQFSVSRKRIRSLPIEFYQQMDQWMRSNVRRMDDLKDWKHPLSNHSFQRYLEWTWELMFMVVKPTDSITHSLSSGRKILVTYGAGNYFQDVTQLFLSKFIIEGDIIRIPPLKLVRDFGDPLVGTVKLLRIATDHQTIEISEDGSMILK